MRALSFNRWESLNEAVIGWDERSGLAEFYNDAIELLRLYGERAEVNYLEIDDLKAIGDHNDIEIVTYDEFFDELPDDVKHTAPSKKAKLFALVNPNTGEPRVVINLDKIDRKALDHIYHMLKHEVIHTEQFRRRPDHVETKLPNPNDRTEYFSNKDEVMAFSHSIADLLAMSGRYEDAEEAMQNLGTIRLYNTIKKSVGPKILKRYHKYIYAYLQNEL